MAAVGELEHEYEGRIRFVVISPEETARRADEIEAFGFTDLRHGLVGFDAAGRVEVKLEGHQFGRDEIVGVIEVLLADAELRAPRPPGEF